MTQIDIESVKCAKCRDAASLDENGECEFCRRGSLAETTADIRRIGWRFAIAISIAVGAIVVTASAYFLGPR